MMKAIKLIWWMCFSLAGKRLKRACQFAIDKNNKDPQIVVNQMKREEALAWVRLFAKEEGMEDFRESEICFMIEYLIQLGKR